MKLLSSKRYKELVEMEEKFEKNIFEYKNKIMQEYMNADYYYRQNRYFSELTQCDRLQEEIDELENKISLQRELITKLYKDIDLLQDIKRRRKK